MCGNYSVIVFLLFGFCLQGIFCQTQVEVSYDINIYLFIYLEVPTDHMI